MGLIESPRHSRADIEHWKKMEAFDTVLARSEALTRKEAKALQVIRDFAAAGPCYVGTSWGKDSIVVAHLAWRLYAEGLRLPVVWLPAGGLENPDCPRVRDAFLARFPVDYHEVEAASEERPWGETEGHDGAQEAFEREARRFGTRYISGVRAEESSIRRLRMRMDGEISKNTCRPIGWWTGEDVFAYLHKYDLPIHPAYAMTFGGMLDRKLIRVSTIGGERGRRFGRGEWERHYYGDVLETINENSGA